MGAELQDRVAVVTGASKGIGLAVATALAAAGARVVAASRTSSAELDALADKHGLVWVPVNLTHAEGVSMLADTVGERVDILVNNVGSAPARPGGFLSVTDAQWQQTIELNLFAAVAVTRALLPRMLDAGRGAIVNIGSVNAVLPDPTVVDYSAAKAALVNFSKALSKEFGARGVRVNSVSPGPVETELWLGGGGVADTVSTAAGLTPEQVLAQAAGATVTGRFSRPQEIADVVLFLAGDRASNIVGSDFTVDGGFVPTW
ncbi:oxidoreductase [Streptomyces gilvus]|uniref:oxidoreductase n=1 Tax=Streptomyces gilvus TaxID=2920937 RepID=UPI001F10FFD4|nr:oxidoreductase [Streptomyces sp. CME 23]MCH5676889.1 oxidoreductase [Streptomyces sp. CME 23]